MSATINCLQNHYQYSAPTVRTAFYPHNSEYILTFNFPPGHPHFLTYFMRMFFKNTGCALSTASILWYFVSALRRAMTSYCITLLSSVLICLLFYIILMNKWMDAVCRSCICLSSILCCILAQTWTFRQYFAPPNNSGTRKVCTKILGKKSKRF